MRLFKNTFKSIYYKWYLFVFVSLAVENKFLVWLRKDDDWVVIDRQMLDTLFDNRDLTKEEKETLKAEEEAEAEAEEEAEAEAGEAEAEEVLEEGVAEAEEAVAEAEAEAEEAEAEEAEAVEAEAETEEVVEETSEAAEAKETEPQTPPSQEDIEVKAGLETGVDDDDQKLSMSEVLFGQKENN